MLFDTWAGMLPPAQFRAHVIEPTRRIVAALRTRCPGVPVIGFPRLAGLMLAEYVAETGVSAVGIDTSADMALAARQVPAGGGAAGQSGSAGPGRRRRCHDQPGAGDPGGDAGPAAGVQPGARHRAGNAAGACRRVWWRRCAVAERARRVAIVLFNLGGPDRPEAIRPFLVNLFTDPAILRVPFFVRPFLARHHRPGAGEARHRELRAAGRPIAAAGTDTAAGRGAGIGVCRTMR